MNRCGNCKHLGEEAMAFPEGEYTLAPSGYWVCNLIEHVGDDHVWGSGRAHVVDGSGYYAALRVREDFGCVLWEAKDHQER